MNDEIEKLLNELGWGMGDPGDDCMQCSPFDPHEFAKRIIEECMEIADMALTEQHDLFLPSELISKHFGIEVEYE